MSWQRINEDTYIDDSLVTCAEYQLFIDEMREQGKYYQPDHWTSYQFPEGNARKPILGVRHSDAVAFCEWLTQRENGKSEYRVPFYSETQDYPIKSYVETPLGYSIRCIDQFIWISSVPQAPLGDIIMAASALAHAIGGQRYSPFDSNWDGPFYEIAIKNIDNALTSTFYSSQNYDYSTALNHTIFGHHALNLDRTLDYAYALDSGRTVERAVEHAISRNWSFPRVVDLFREQELLAIRDRVININFSQVLEKQAFDFAFALALYVDLSTLQERIAGRSPAFEGIRIVKERMK